MQFGRICGFASSFRGYPLFHYDIIVAADQDKMFNIIAPHQNKPSAVIYRRGIDHCQTLAPMPPAGKKHAAPRLTQPQQTENGDQHRNKNQ